MRYSNYYFNLIHVSYAYDIKRDSLHLKKGYACGNIPKQGFLQRIPGFGKWTQKLNLELSFKTNFS